MLWIEVVVIMIAQARAAVQWEVEHLGLPRVKANWCLAWTCPTLAVFELLLSWAQSLIWRSTHDGLNLGLAARVQCILI